MSDVDAELVGRMAELAARHRREGYDRGWRAAIAAVRGVLAAAGQDTAVAVLDECEVAAFVAELDADAS